MCRVTLRHKDKIATCRFFVVSGNGPALLRVYDTELLDMLKIMYEMMQDQQEDGKFDYQKIQSS